MPAYGSQNYVQSLMPGDVGSSLSTDVANATIKGLAFGIPSAPGLGNAADGRTVRWQTIFGGTALATVSMQLQGAMSDVDSEYSTIDTSTNVAGEARTVVGVRARFLRIIEQAVTGGDGTSRVTAKMLP